MTEIVSNVADERKPVPDEVNPADDAEDPETANWNWLKAIEDHNLRLAGLAKSGKLTTDDVFHQNEMRDGVKAFIADWLKQEFGRDCRDADGKIDFDKEYEDGIWTNGSLILDALIPLVIETCGIEYADGVVDSTRFLHEKCGEILSELKAGQYRDASVAVALP